MITYITFFSKFDYGFYILYHIIMSLLEFDDALECDDANDKRRDNDDRDSNDDFEDVFNDIYEGDRHSYESLYWEFINKIKSDIPRKTNSYEVNEIVGEKYKQDDFGMGGYKHNHKFSYDMRHRGIHQCWTMYHIDIETEFVDSRSSWITITIKYAPYRYSYTHTRTIIICINHNYDNYACLRPSHIFKYSKSSALLNDLLQYIMKSDHNTIGKHDTGNRDEHIHIEYL
jgi:hypothetical protein